MTATDSKHERPRLLSERALVLPAAARLGFLDSQCCSDVTDELEVVDPFLFL